MIQDLLKELDYESWRHEYDFCDWSAAWDFVMINDPDSDMYSRLAAMTYPWWMD